MVHEWHTVMASSAFNYCTVCPKDPISLHSNHTFEPNRLYWNDTLQYSVVWPKKVSPSGYYSKEYTAPLSANDWGRRLYIQMIEKGTTQTRIAGICEQTNRKKGGDKQTIAQQQQKGDQRHRRHTRHIA